MHDGKQSSGPGRQPSLQHKITFYGDAEFITKQDSFMFYELKLLREKCDGYFAFIPSYN